MVERSKRVGVLGYHISLSHVIEESSGILLCQKLSDLGYKLNVHDPLALENVSYIKF